MKYLLPVLALLSLPSSVLADGFEVTGQTNVSVCASVDVFCSPVTFTLDLTTQFGPNPAFPGFGNVFNVISLDGFVDGLFPIVGGGGFLLPVPGNPQSPVPFGSISYTLNGQQGFIFFDDLIAGSSALTTVPPIGGGSGGFSYVTWNATPFTAPEPSSLTLSSIGMLLLIGFGLHKTASTLRHRRNSR